jgi:hypothetical protein
MPTDFWKWKTKKCTLTYLSKSFVSRFWNSSQCPLGLQFKWTLVGVFPRWSSTKFIFVSVGNTIWPPPQKLEVPSSQKRISCVERSFSTNFYISWCSLCNSLGIVRPHIVNGSRRFPDMRESELSQHPQFLFSFKFYFDRIFFFRFCMHLSKRFH